ncbi:minor tail protein [Mycobacterium phage prophiT37-1]|nr:minor tail protein [Mycobacterium phage prophiT37-1]
MPRSVDLVPQNFKTEYDPTNQLAQDPALKKTINNLGDVLKQLPVMIQKELQRLIDSLLGIATNPIPEIIEWLDELKKGIANVLSWIKPGLLPLIPLSQIGEWFPNLLLNGGFDTDAAVADNPDWLWDGTIGRTSPLGSVKAIMAGTAKYLHSNAIPVAKKQHLELEVFTRWQGLAAGAGTNPIRLVVTSYLAGNPVSSTVVAQHQPSADDSSGWVELHGTYTVPDTGVDEVRTTLLVTGDATAGTVWFDDADTWKTGKLPQDYVQDLVTQLEQFGTDIGNALEELAHKVGLDRFKEFFDTVAGQVNAEIGDVQNRLAAITADGKIDAAEILGLLGLGNIPLLPQTKVTDLPDLNAQLNQIRDIFAGLVVTPINSTIQAVKDWFGLSNNKTQKLTAVGTLNAGDVVGNFDMGRVNDLVSNLGDMLTGVKTGADGTATSTTGTIGEQINQAKESLLSLLGLSRDALKSAIAAQTTLQEQETEQNTGGGNSYSFTFSGADGAALNSTDWTTGPNPGDITIRGDSGYAGVKNGNPDGYFFASPNYTYATDGQSASFVLGDTQNGNYYSGVYIRCDSGRTQGAYCLAKEGEIRIGKFTRSGSSWSFNTPLTLQTGLSAVKQGARIEIRCSGTNYFVRVNGRQILSATDASNTINIGAAYRYSMFSVQRASPFFTYDSYRIAAFAMSDYTSAGAGFSMSNSWSIRRDSTADVTYGPYTSGAFPSGFFTFNDYTTDVTLDDLGTARIEIATTGLYRINTTYRSVTAKGTSVPYWTLYKNGTRITGAIPSGCPFEIPLVAGDVVQPGFIAVDYDIRSNGSTGSETVVPRSITALSGIATFDGRRVA